MKKIFNYIFLLIVLATNFTIVSCSENEDEDNESVVTNVVSLTNLEAVDLGLSVDWANCNIGAKEPEDFGTYYFWADPFGNNNKSLVNNVPDCISNTSYDIVSMNFGNGWRLPTKEEANEFLEKCTFTTTTRNGVSGHEATGPNGNSIFIPYSGCIEDGKLCNENTAYIWTGNKSNDEILYMYFGQHLLLPSLYMAKASVRGVKSNTNSSGETSGGGSSSTYEKPEIGFHDFTAWTSKLKVVYKIYNKDEAKVTSAKVYYGTSRNPSQSVTATVSGVLITANISGLKAGTEYYVKCSATGKGGTSTTDVTKCITNYK